MPNPGSDRPLRRITINLYEEDCTYAERMFGYGWAKIVRDLLHDHVKTCRKIGNTLGDLDE